ncbi:MAG TPA: hypothetical protein VIY28_10525, partial [Pseudonocardiaceae bacterium]
MGRNRADGAGDKGSTPRLPADVAREWAGALTTTTYVPMSLPDVECYLHELTEQLVAALSGPAADIRACCAEVGARLVAGGFTGPQSLSHTVEVLARGLPKVTDGSLAGRMIDLLGALVGGYTSALRDHILDQQEKVRQALSIAWRNVERDLQASEARFREVFNSAAVGIAISELGACGAPIDKKLSMSRPCATLEGDPSVAEGDSRLAGTTQYCWLSQIRPKGTQRPRFPRGDHRATHGRGGR